MMGADQDSISAIALILALAIWLFLLQLGIVTLSVDWLSTLMAILVSVLRRIVHVVALR